jgi:hypothetical protein
MLIYLTKPAHTVLAKIDHSFPIFHPSGKRKITTHLCVTLNKGVCSDDPYYENIWRKSLSWIHSLKTQSKIWPQSSYNILAPWWASISSCNMEWWIQCRPLKLHPTPLCHNAVQILTLRRFPHLTQRNESQQLGNVWAWLFSVYILQKM